MVYGRLQQDDVERLERLGAALQNDKVLMTRSDLHFLLTMLRGVLHPDDVARLGWNRHEQPWHVAKAISHSFKD